MAHTEPKQRVRVVKSEERDAHEQLRRVGRAIIALARAQLEAEAQAAHERQPDTVSSDRLASTKSGGNHDPSQ